MFRRLVVPFTLIGALLLSALITHSGTIALAAQADVRYFPETQHTVRGLFLQYWTSHGGLAQQGYPLTEEFSEQSALDGKTYQVQYFERAVFERHPENAGTPYEVLLAQLGNYELKAHYPGGTPASAPSTTNARPFPETGHSIGGTFRTYWEGQGGLAQQGYPLTDELTEVSALDGTTYTVQYFERAVFEQHPENAGTPYEVLLAQLGKYQLDRRYPNNSNPAAAPVPPSGGPTPVATQLPAATQPPATQPPAPATATVPPPPPSGQCAAGAGITARAWVSDPTPSGGSLAVSGAICNNGQGLANIPMHTDWHYRTTTPSCDGVSGADGVASCSRSIGNAASGFTVVIDVTFTVNGQPYRTTTSFTPR